MLKNILICLCVLGLFLTFMPFLIDGQPVYESDEPQVIVASVKLINGDLSAPGKLLPTQPALGLLIFGLPTLTQPLLSKTIINIPLSQTEPRESAVIALKKYPNQFFELKKIEMYVLILFYCVSAVLLYLIAKLFFPDPIALVPTLLFIYSEAWHWVASVLYFEIFQLTFILTAIYLLFKHQKTKTLAPFLLFILAYSLSVGIRHNSLYLLIGFIILLFPNLKKIGLLIFSSILSAILFYPHAIHVFTNNLLFPPNTFSEVYFDFNPIPTLSNLIINQFSGIELIYLLVLIGAMLYTIDTRTKPTHWLNLNEWSILLASILITACFIQSTNNSFPLLGRYTILSTIPLYFLATLYLSQKIFGGDSIGKTSNTTGGTE